MSHACKSVPKNIFNFKKYILFYMYIVTNKSQIMFLYSGIPGLRRDAAYYYRYRYRTKVI